MTLRLAAVEAEDFFERALDRINTIMVVLMAGGMAVAAGLRGWKGLAGFFLGASVSYFYFRWIKQMVDALAPDARPPRKRLVAFLTLRYVVFGASGYAIVKYFGISLPAALAGLFVSVAAIIVEIIYELLYVRS